MKRKTLIILTFIIIILITPMFVLKYINDSKTINNFGMVYIKLNTGEIIHLTEVKTIEATIWKGSVDGLLYYEDGSFEEVDVSSYGNFFGIKEKKRSLFSNGVLYQYNFSDIE